MLKYRAIALLFVLPSVVIGHARAADETSPDKTSANPEAMVIEAQHLEMFLDRKMRATGDAEMRQDDKAIFGDRIDYDTLNEELHVVGNTRVEQNGLRVLGPELRLIPPYRGFPVHPINPAPARGLHAAMQNASFSKDRTRSASTRPDTPLAKPVWTTGI
jgi:hypothetical protein